MKNPKFFLLCVLVLALSSARAQSLKNGNKFIVAPSMCNVVYVGYPTTLMSPFDLKYYYCKTDNGILKKEGINNLSLTAIHKGQVRILIHKTSSNQIVDSFFLRALELPLPIAVITGKHFGKMSKKILIQQKAFYFQWEGVVNDFENVSTKIIDSFNVMILRDDRVVYNEKCKGFKFTDETMRQLEYLKRGDLFVINKMYGYLNSLEVEFNPIMFEIED